MSADDITVLIGADVARVLVGSEIREGPNDAPIVIRTQLGWAMFGMADGKAYTDQNELSNLHIRVNEEKTLDNLVQSFWNNDSLGTVHEITASHRSLSGTISCVTDSICFLLVTMTGRFSNFNSISYKEDRHELRMTGTKCRLSDTMSGTGEICISGAVVPYPLLHSQYR